MVITKLGRSRVNWLALGERLVLLVVIGGLGLYAIWPWLLGREPVPTRTLVLYGFSILGDVINEGIFPAFEAEWQARTGENVELISSFAGSGTITNQIIMGVPAEVTILSLELDALRLVENGVVDGSTWRDLPYGGVLNRTPFIILVRPGNPQNIQGFIDLTQPGVGIVHPDPITSGGAQWALLAEYGSMLGSSGDSAAATGQLLALWRNVVAQASSARGARTQFDNGFGDALITYEQEAIYDRARGRLSADIIYPSSTILSEHTVVIIEDNVDPANRQLVDAFVAFLWSDRAQRIFVDYGFRSVNESLNYANVDFGLIAKPFTIEDIGGWEQAKREIIDGIWRERVLPEINR